MATKDHTQSTIPPTDRQDAFNEVERALQDIDAMAGILATAACSDREDVSGESLTMFAWKMQREAKIARDVFRQFAEMRQE